MDYRDPDWVAERLGLDKNTVYKFLQDGRIPALQLGRKWLISESRLAEWMREETDSQTRSRREAVTSTNRTVRRMTNLTPESRAVLRQAHAEARRYGDHRLGQEHLLLALLAEADGPADRAMRLLKLNAEDVRRQVEGRIESNGSSTPRRLARRPQARKAMRLAMREAQRSAATRIGTGHLLLGIVLSGEGLGHDILAGRGVTAERLRHALSDARSEAGEGN
jgi:excisionase family DNA binding protein